MQGLESYRGGWIAVTGGAEGIGLAIARALARAVGMKAALIDIRQEAADAAAAALGAEGIEAAAFAADVSDRDSIAAASTAMRRAGIVPQILWINAGVAAGVGVLTAPPRAAEWVYGVNALGIIWTAQAFIPAMLESARPVHVGITASSAAYTAPNAPFTLYAASKHATLALGEALRSELAAHATGVTIFCPGLLNTTIWDGAKARPDRFGGSRRAPDAQGDRWRAALLPEVTMPDLLATIAAGGGYCATFTEQRAVDEYDERVAAMRSAIRVVGD